MIGIIDYGMGNLKSVQKAFEHQGADVVVSSRVADLEPANGLVFPGQGAFKDAMKNVQESGLVDFMQAWIQADRPFLGICMGMQLLLSNSEEGGDIAGLNIIPGSVRRFPPGEKVPQMGWNSVHKTAVGQTCPLLDGIKDGEYFYFVHSYYVDPLDTQVSALTTDYMVTYTSMLWRSNLFAVQFHPEKSQDAGLRLLTNFINIADKNG